MTPFRSRWTLWTGSVSVAALLLPAAAFGQLRVSNWNITFYSGDDARKGAFQTALYDSFEGRSYRPDLIIAQEVTSQAGTDSFVRLLNTAPGSPGDWAAAKFYDGADTDQEFFYRTSKVVLLATTVVSQGGTDTHPRNIMRYDLRPVGYSSEGAVVACYSSHMKSGATDTDKSRRLVECQIIRADAETLPAAWSFILGGDFNIPDSADPPYQELVKSKASDSGRFFDPIKTPGRWNNNDAFRFVHTQDPVGAGGMDDRFDQLLVSAELLDGAGMDYIGKPSLAYSVTTWDDPNHSYRSWGNDGTSFNKMLTTTGNTMVGADIAQALIDAAQSGGHLPVFMDVRVPARIEAPLVIDFGTVPQGAVAEQPFTVANSGDTALWTEAGIAALNYAFAFSPGFADLEGGGPFADAPGGDGRAHTVSMDTTMPGPKSGLLTITSDAPDDPVWFVTLIGEVAAGCKPDCNGDGKLNINDFICMQAKWRARDAYGDYDGSGTYTVNDFIRFQADFAKGCG